MKLTGTKAKRLRCHHHDVGQSKKQLSVWSSLRGLHDLLVWRQQDREVQSDLRRWRGPQLNHGGLWMFPSRLRICSFVLDVTHKNPHGYDSALVSPGSAHG